MFRGSTPTHEFELPISTENLQKVIIAYAQDDVEILRKTEEDCEISGNVIALQLSQKETLLFDWKKKMQIQLKVLWEDGAVSLSDVMEKEVRKCLIDEVIQ